MGTAHVVTWAFQPSVLGLAGSHGWMADCCPVPSGGTHCCRCAVRKSVVVGVRRLHGHQRFAGRRLRAACVARLPPLSPMKATCSLAAAVPKQHQRDADSRAHKLRAEALQPNSWNE